MIQIVEAGADRFDDVLSIWNPVWPEFANDVEGLKHDETLDESLRSRYWLALDGSQLAGLLEISHVSGSFHPQRWSMNVIVLENMRRQGVGRALYEFGKQQIAPSDPLSVLTVARENDEAGIRFAESRGFTEVKRDFISELDLSLVNKELIDKLASTPMPEDIRIVTAAELDSSAFRHAFHELFEDVRRDVPRSFPPTPLTFEQFESAFLDPAFHWRCGMFAMQGDKPIGFTVGFKGSSPEKMMQGLTGVSSRWRGHGIAKALKAHFIKTTIREGFTTIATDNDTRNAPMLAINEKLGFKGHPGCIHFLWSANGE